MKVAVSASSPDLDGSVDARFGRCSYFVIVDPETMESEAVENSYVSASGGAGIQAAQLVAGKGVQAVLTGSCGPNAFQTLKAAGVKVVVGVTGTVREVIRSYISGAEFREASGPDVPPHFGMQRAAVPGQGRGRGMGRPRGRGATGPFEQPQRPVQGQGAYRVSPQEELELLKRQSHALREQMETISKRIAALEKKGK
jgi:predicted Fe-Mo cluster-binding NifX family protein